MSRQQITQPIVPCHAVFSDNDSRSAETVCGGRCARLLQEQRLTTIGSLTTGLAHEISNRLNGVLGATELADADASGAAWPWASQVAEDARRLGELVWTLQAFVHGHGGGRRPARADEILTPVLALCRPELRRDGMTMTLHIDADLPVVWCRLNHLQHAIIAVVLEAHDMLVGRDDSGPGERQLQLAATARTDDDGTWLRLTVAGGGEGTWPARPPSPDVGGAGRQLAREIAKAHAGRLTPASGAAGVIVELPADPDWGRQAPASTAGLTTGAVGVRPCDL